MIAGADLARQARTWLGIPYRHQGRAATGLDCLGLIKITLDHFELWPPDIEDPLDYPSAVNDRMALMVAQRCKRLTAARLGCLILIRWPAMEHATHIAFYSGNGRMIHCYGRVGKVIENAFGAPWTRMVWGLFQVPGVE